MNGYASIGSIVVVNGERLSLLGLQALFTAVFFLYEVVDTARSGVVIVKSSNMAELRITKTAAMSTYDTGYDRGPMAGGISPKVDGDLWGKLVREGDSWHLEIQRQDLPAEKMSRGKAWFAAQKKARGI